MAELNKPAIEGGTPVRSSVLPYGRQNITDDDVACVVEALKSDWLTTGPKVSEFEEAIAERVGARYAVAFSSGTAALHGAAFAANLSEGDEAITTPLTFAATSNCVLYQSARPIFADISSSTMLIDPAEIEKKISVKTKAILPVDYAGHPVDLDAIQNIAQKHGLLIIEDACHALGATYREKTVGSIADMTVFSFHPVKHITTCEGGMVTTRDKNFADRLRRFRSHGIDRDVQQRQSSGGFEYDMVELGYNYRLPDVLCALGIRQLRTLDANLESRRQIAASYNRTFKTLEGVKAPLPSKDGNSAWHLYPLRLDLPKLRVGRIDVFRALKKENIGVNVHYLPVHLHSYYRNRFGYKAGDYPRSEAVYEELISLPMFHAMTQKDVADVIEAVTKVIRFYSAVL